MIYAVEAWTFAAEGGEEPCETEMIRSAEFEDWHDALAWASDRLEEGFFVKMYRDKGAEMSKGIGAITADPMPGDHDMPF